MIKLAVNGKFVNGIAQTSQKKGYLGLQSEGAEIHFRNVRIMELLPGVTSRRSRPRPICPERSQSAITSRISCQPPTRKAPSGFGSWKLGVGS